MDIIRQMIIIARPTTTADTCAVNSIDEVIMGKNLSPSTQVKSSSSATKAYYIRRTVPMGLAAHTSR